MSSGNSSMSSGNSSMSSGNSSISGGNSSTNSGNSSTSSGNSSTSSCNSSMSEPHTADFLLAWQDTHAANCSTALNVFSSNFHTVRAGTSMQQPVLVLPQLTQIFKFP